MGRLYLPLDWMAQAGLDPGRLPGQPPPEPGPGGGGRTAARRADRLYVRAEPGIAAPAAPLPSGDPRARSRIYSRIGRVVAQNGYDSVTRRARVDGLAKLGHALGAALPSAGREGLGHPPLAQTQFLVASIAGHPAPRVPRGLPSWWDLRGRVLHVLDLIERLREREAFAQAGQSEIAR